MKYPSTELKNPYYFLSTNDPKVIYEISDQQDKDGCGQHFVTYQTTDRVVNAGQSYLDLHGDRIQVSESGTFPVSTGKLNIAECKKTFPYFEVVYSATENGSETESVYFWLDYLIEDDDKYVDGKFVMNTDHKDVDDDFEGGYATYYKEMAIRELGALLATHSIEEAKRNFPDYLFANVNDPIIVNGNTVYLQELNSSDGNMTEEGNPNTITEDDIDEAYYEYVCEQVKAYADRLVKKNNPNADAMEVLPCFKCNNSDEGRSEDTTTTHKITLPEYENRCGKIIVSGYGDDINHIPHGTNITVNVSLSKGCSFVSVEINGEVITELPYTFPITEDVEIGNETYGNDDTIEPFDPSVQH